MATLQIDYLVSRKYPTAGMLKIPPSLSSRGPRPDTRQLRAQVDACRTELEALSADELTARYSAERAAEAAEMRAKADRAERDRFFHQPWAVADFEHWAKAAHWTLDEAIALSFGKAPERVRWPNVQEMTAISPFAFQYSRRRDLALRAIQWKQLYDPVLPGIFLAWAKRLSFDLPLELEAAVTARGVRVADWQSLFEELKQSYDALSADLRKQQGDWLSAVAGRDEIIARLESRLAEASNTSSAMSDKPLGTRERESLLKLLVGMAIGGYGFDPSASRSEQVTAIASDLAEQGIPLDVDTVRKWLKAAAELLPGR